MEKDQQDNKILYRLTFIALAISMSSLGLLVGINITDGNFSIVLWLILLLVSIFVSIPLHGFILLNSLFRLNRGQTRGLQWVFLYLLISLSGHLFVAFSWGGFDQVKDDINAKIRAIEGSKSASPEKNDPLIFPQ